MRTVYEARASTALFRLAAAIPDRAGLYLLPANVCPVVPLALMAAGRRFELIDLEARTLSMSEDLLRERLAGHGWSPVAGVVYVRTYGAELDAGPLFSRLRTLDPQLLIIDDRCLCRPVPDISELDRQGADAVLFSTGYAKQVDLGFGGFAHLDDRVPYVERHRRFDDADLERITALYKAHIRSRTPIYRHGGAGGRKTGSRRGALDQLFWLETTRPAMAWDEYRALVLAKRNEAEDHRARINAIYRELICEAARLPDAYHHWRFQVRVLEPAALLEKIFAAGLFASDHFYPAATLFGGHPCPIATHLQAEVVNLFNDFRISEPGAGKIGRIVARHLETNGWPAGRAGDAHTERSRR